MMSKAAGIQANPFFKLGKSPAKRDPRNLAFASILRAKELAPVEYDFDLKHSGIPLPMFANDTLGDCVIAGRAHQTLRFEDVDQGRVITIADKAVTTEYFKETCGVDSGLVVLDSIKLWRSAGWKVGRRRFRIAAFSEIDRRTPEALRQAIYLDIGAGLGIMLPLSAQDQITAGKPWDAVSGPRGKIGSWGGHYVHVPGYTEAGPVCVTWGRKQQMTWAFFAKYCDEAYAIIDKLDSVKKRRGIDAGKVAAFLETVHAPPGGR